MNRKVLLIDDSITIHRVIDLSIDDEKFDVEKVFSSEEANAKIDSFSPDIVLLDNKLDNTRIEDYIREIKGKIPASSMILLVGAFDNFSEEDAERLGADDYLVKPFNSGSLDEKLSAFSEAQDVTAPVTETVEEKDEAVEELMASIDTSEDADGESLDDLFADETPEVQVDELAEEAADDMFSGLEELTEESGAIVETEEISEPTVEENVDDLFDGLEDEPVETEVVEEDAEEESMDDFLGSLDTADDDIEFDSSDEADVSVEKVDDIADTILDDLIEDSTEPEPVVEEAPIDIPEEESVDDIFADLQEDDEDLAETEVPVVEELVEAAEETLEAAEPIEEDILVDDPVVEEEPIVEELLEVEEEPAPVVESIEEVEEPIEEIVQEVAEPVEEAVEPIVMAAAPVATAVDEDKVREIVSDIISEDFLKSVIKDVLSKNLEKVIWEIVPDMAEKLVLEEIERLKKGE